MQLGVLLHLRFGQRLLIGIVEVFFHIYMKRMVLKEEEQVLNSPKKYRGAYATEFSDEYIDRSKIRKEQLLEKSRESQERIENKRDGSCHHPFYFYKLPIFIPIHASMIPLI